MGDGTREVRQLLAIPERLARRYVAAQVGRLTFGLLVLALVPVVTVISIVIFAVLGAVMFALFALLGDPGPPLGSVLGLGWFGGSLLVLVLVLRRGHRWLARLIAIADAPAAWIDPRGDRELIDAERPTAWGEAPHATTFSKRLRAADARQAPPSGSREAPRGKSGGGRDEDPRHEPHG